MFTFIILIPLLLGQRPATLHCHIDLAAGAASKRCEVKAPTGRAIRPCTPSDEQAQHCSDTGGARYVAWVVSAGPGRCRITDKKTTWRKGVVSAKLNEAPGAPSTCDLYVELQ